MQLSLVTERGEILTKKSKKCSKYTCRAFSRSVFMKVAKKVDTIFQTKYFTIGLNQIP